MVFLGGERQALRMPLHRKMLRGDIQRDSGHRI